MFRQLRRLEVVFQQHLREAVMHPVAFCLTLWIAERVVQICTEQTQAVFITSQSQKQRDIVKPSTSPLQTCGQSYNSISCGHSCINKLYVVS